MTNRPSQLDRDRPYRFESIEVEIRLELEDLFTAFNVKPRQELRAHFIFRSDVGKGTAYLAGLASLE